jgi:uncharacterized protein YcbK (DUF882 family)
VRGTVAAVLAAAMVVALTASARAEYQSKKDRERAAKSTKHGAPPPVGAKPAKVVNLYNDHTKDWLCVAETELPSVDQVNRLLRDHFTNEAMPMDVKLIGVVMSAAKQFKSDFVQIVSGFRHPKYNLMLRKKGRQVARDSQHTHGTAVDFTIPRVSIQKLHDWAKAQKLGGVGLYLSSGFIHMDTGPIRFWSGE